MSRCFPFPLPGSEKKARAENIDLLTKMVYSCIYLNAYGQILLHIVNSSVFFFLQEKHKEKKHKKDKREKEKREHKERKDKDRSSDKHKEKKDRKDQHNDKKKDRDREKAGTSEVRRVEDQTEGIFQNAEGFNDSRFTEELGRRIQDDGAANRFLGSFTNSIQTKFQGLDAASGSVEKEKFPHTRVFSGQICLPQRRNDGSGRPMENTVSSLQRKTGTISTTSTLEKERGKIHEKITFSSVAKQNRNHVAHRIPEVSNIASGLEKEKYNEKIVVSGSIATRLDKGKVGAEIAASNSNLATERRNTKSGQTVGNFYSNYNNRINGMGNKPALVNEGAKGYGMFSFSICSELQPVEKDMCQQTGRTNKIEDKKAEEKEQTWSKDNGENSEKRGKDRHNKEKKKEGKIFGKPDEQDMISRNFGLKDRVDTVIVKPLAPHKDNISAVGIDGNTKKRKFSVTNGFLNENVARPDKMPKVTASSQHLTKGGISNLNQATSSSVLLKVSLNNFKHDTTILENKEQNKLNGAAKSQQIPVEPRPPLSEGLVENEEVSLSLPHPDSKYLSLIYTVPKMDKWVDFDDQEWLFNDCDSRQKPQAEPSARKAPIVWAEAVHIESVDVLALPYVVPF
ncbi:hypothetical protein AXF42_Ash000710 [Apostasia shenzhenica]|uniref:Uncharacterized protein n=1 Tax=Apostasia shenzhenica TaxID=1088818 RepID=A0A2I0AH86_9ASPA|nr:hypothetical protein AXF42_Ash000710 [Apostasia shenzhenica]